MYCTPYEIKTGVDYAAKPCRTEVHIDIPSYDSVIANYSGEAMKAVPIIDYSPEPSEDILNNTVLISPTYYGYAYRTVVCIHDPVWMASNVTLMIGCSGRIRICGKSAS